ncbi:MAG: AarF/UbiB family protein [Myxococcota bacterium]
MTRIVGKYGYEGFARKSPGFPQELGSRDFDSDQPPPPAEGARRFRLMLEELGPTFIKFGQVLASRADLVAPDYVTELKLLQDHCEPVDFALIEQALGEELGPKAFASVETGPLATASIAQVHRATTHEGDEVVVKVRRPGIMESIQADIDILYKLARVFDAVFEESRLADPVALVEAFERSMDQELNFRHEAANVRRFAALHEKRERIVVPALYPELSSASVLTIQFLDGVPLSRLPPEADKARIARHVIEEAFTEVFVDGVFHADPHAGNLLYLGEDRYGILDFGLIGQLNPQMQETLVVLALAVALRDPDSVARTIVRLGRAEHRIDLGALRRDVAELFEEALDRSISEVDSRVLVAKLVDLGLGHGIRLPADYALLARASATIEGVVRSLDPDIDVASVARPFAERLLMERVAPENVQGGLYRALLQLQGLQDELPLQLSQIMSDLAGGRLGVSVGGREVERLREVIATSANTLAGAVLAGAFIIGAFIGLARLEGTLFGVPIVGIVGALVGMVVLVFLLAYALVRPRVRKLRLRGWLSRKSH